MKNMFKKAGFSFTLTDFYDEQSKDSNRSSNTYSLESRTLSHEYVHIGFPDDKNQIRELRANNSMIEAIKNKIKTLGLYTNYDKLFPVDQKGFLIRNGTRLSIQDGTEKYSISVTGGLSSEIKDEVYHKLGQLYVYIASLLRSKRVKRGSV